MKTLSQVIRENKQFKPLIQAVIDGLGSIDYVEDVNRHGIDCGYGDFIYYSDTHKFAIDNQKQIVAMLEDMADQLGEDVVQMVSSFKCLNMDADEKRDLYKYLSFVAPEQGQVTNAMAWFAAETVCRMFES